jgi:hypothetical protein
MFIPSLSGDMGHLLDCVCVRGYDAFCHSIGLGVVNISIFACI